MLLMPAPPQCQLRHGFKHRPPWSAARSSVQALERVAGLLEDGAGLVLGERGDTAALARHPNFRLMAAMNPASDVGVLPRC